MRAHPAGPLHAGLTPAPESAGPRPGSSAELDHLAPAVWPRNATRGADGALSVAGADVRDLAREHGTPLFVLDEDDFRSRCAEFAAAFGAGSVHYAAKAFLCTEVARWVAQEGLSLDVCSGGELAVALRAEFPPERIALHGNNKSTEELVAAVDAGVGGIVLDSFDEIARLDAVAAERGRTARVLIRLTVGVEAHTHEYIATAHEDQKFGFSIASGAGSDGKDSAALEAARRVVTARHLELVGLHSHIGSQIFETEGFEAAARRVVRVLADLHTEHGSANLTALRTLDLGGGIGIAYRPADTPLSMPALAEELRSIVKRECAAAGLDVPGIAVEPGRAIAGPGTVTLYEVGTIKDVPLGGYSRRYVSVDGGMSDNIRTALYDAEYDVRLVSRSSERDSIPDGAEPVLCRVVGKHCESGDIVVRDCWLPADLAPGDLLAVAATGAYCYAMASGYNRLPRPAVVAVREGADRTLLRRETLEDQFRFEV
ncbi:MULTISPECIES: diaminopimelate decarboxylase [Pseudonocardia]|uniref:Diaminopimelate decarboxylase n=2 Tax=Pseudonocardia TaxID=1847 RepID=A0A1Y2N7K4_PSEAH|nr:MULTISPECIES: diaminopimelate decarboxylase [Pseudonocardia]OSY43436.1 Diaminopimelate decarboxylase [Pseudonocardia autotrophica]TDN73568.1 diaminopimelate decarboxylase [Pseudonocardia autotrophica]BBG04313.1 diaminopimelate decarboxylase [Pseudonocardia autotrophica]GEC25544.1 diaminopimelate decarboxylase [Pseudonocardia saturnea]